MVKKISFFILCIAMIGMTSCKRFGGGGNSASDDYTGWKYNDQEWGGFEKVDYAGQIDAPNLILIEGGTFTMGSTEEDILYEWNSICLLYTSPSPRDATLSRMPSSA